MDRIEFLVIDAARVFRQVFDQFVEKDGLGLTAGDVRTLGYVLRYKGSRQSVLAELMGIEPMSLSAFLDRLAARGLIERKTDPSDRRAKLIEPTQKGKDTFLAFDPAFDDLYRLMSRGIDEEEMDELAAGLRRMRANLTEDPRINAPFSLLPGNKAAD